MATKKPVKKPAKPVKPAKPGKAKPQDSVGGNPPQKPPGG